MCTGSRSWSRMLAIASSPLHNLWNLKFTLPLNLLFQINTRQLFRPCGYSSVVSSTLWYVLLRWASCHKTMLEEFQFQYFSGQSSHNQAYVVVPGDSDVCFTFGSVCEVYQCPINVIFPLLEFAQTLSRESTNSLERVWQGRSVHLLYRTAHWGRAGDGTYSQITGGVFWPPSWCHRRSFA